MLAFVYPFFVRPERTLRARFYPKQQTKSTVVSREIIKAAILKLFAIGRCNRPMLLTTKRRRSFTFPFLWRGQRSDKRPLWRTIECNSPKMPEDVRYGDLMNPLNGLWMGAMKRNGLVLESSPCPVHTLRMLWVVFVTALGMALRYPTTPVRMRSNWIDSARSRVCIVNR